MSGYCNRCGNIQCLCREIDAEIVKKEILNEIGAPCCLYKKTPYCVEFLNNEEEWIRDSNWMHNEFEDAFERVETIKKLNWAKDARLIRIRFEVLKGE